MPQEKHFQANADQVIHLLLRYDRITSYCNIALVGKYTQLEDSYASVIKALRHAAYAVNRKLKLTVSRPWIKPLFIPIRF